MKANGSVLFGLALLLPMLVAGDWTLYRGDEERSGGSTELLAPKQPAAEPLSLVWNWDLSTAGIMSSPAVADGRVYVGTENGQLSCRRVSDGALIWAYQTEGAIRCSPVHAKGRLYFGARDRRLYALHAETGTLLWSVFHGGDQISSPLVANGRLFVGVGDPSTEVRAYDAKTGVFLWAFALGQMVYSSPAYHNGKIIVGAGSGRWVALAETDGALRWEFKTDGGGVYVSTASVDGDMVAVAPGENDRGVYILNATTGALIRKVTPVPPGAQKAGGAPDGSAQVTNPAEMVDQQELEMLKNLPKAERDARIDFLAKGNPGVDYKPLKEWLDVIIGDVTPPPDAKQKAVIGGAGIARVNLSKPIKTSSPTFRNGRVYITQREISGGASDEFIGYCIDAASGTVLWNTPQQSLSIVDNGYVPSAAVSADQYVYIPVGKRIYAYNISGAQIGVIDTGAVVGGSLAIANGMLYAVTDVGEVRCYTGANTPPIAPTAFAPSGGDNVLTPSVTLTWSGAADADGAVGYEVRIGVGDANSDLALLDDPPAVLGTGVVQYTIPQAIPAGSRVYYSVRAYDQNGARSEWSPTQTFWFNKDVFPPDPPENVAAVALSQGVRLTWNHSASADVVKYSIYYKKAGESFSNAMHRSVDYVTTVDIDQLENWQPYDFMITAVDRADNDSVGVIVTVTPKPSIIVVPGPPPTPGQNVPPAPPATVPDPAPSFATIQDAINAALPGDTVRVGVGVFHGPFALKGGVSLVGVSPTDTKIMGGSSSVVINVAKREGGPAKDPVSISMMTIVNGVTAIHVDKGAVVNVSNVLIYGTSGDAVTIDDGAKTAIRNCTIVNNKGSGVLSASADTVVRSSIVGGNTGYGIAVPPNAVLLYNNVYGNINGNNPNKVIITGEVFKPAAFVDEANGDYRERSDSPTVDAGDPSDEYTNEPQPNGGRVNMGAFGNTPYAAPSVEAPKIDEGTGGTGVVAGGGDAGTGGTTGTDGGAVAVDAGAGGGGGGGGGCYVTTASANDRATPLGIAVLAVLLLVMSRMRFARR